MAADRPPAEEPDHVVPGVMAWPIVASLLAGMARTRRTVYTGVNALFVGAWGSSSERKAGREAAGCGGAGRYWVGDWPDRARAGAVRHVARTSRRRAGLRAHAARVFPAADEVRSVSAHRSDRRPICRA